MKSLRILLVNFIIWSLAFSVSYWDQTDCGLYWGMPYKNDWFEPINVVYKLLSDAGHEAIINKTDLETAVFNLQKYCCENEFWWQNMKVWQCADDEKYFNTNALDSKYLFDHLFDVVMRRLSWLNSDTNIYTKTNMTIDDVWNYSWKKWREFIKDKAEDLEWSDATSIESKYEEFWKDTWEYNIVLEVGKKFDSDRDKFLAYITWKGWDESEKVAEAFRSYQNRTLMERYKYACMVTEYLYVLIDNMGSLDKNTKIGKICEDAVQQQIKNEEKYVKVVEQRAGNKLLTNYIKWYISYLEDRWNQLNALWKNASDRFLDVVRAVPWLVKKCVK